MNALFLEHYRIMQNLISRGDSGVSSHTFMEISSVLSPAKENMYESQHKISYSTKDARKVISEIRLGRLEVTGELTSRTQIKIVCHLLAFFMVRLMFFSNHLVLKLKEKLGRRT